jgi:hypothetical protein
MSERDWQTLYDSLEIQKSSDTPKGMKPTAATLSEYEAATGFKLPLDYCDFIKVFGPGELGRVFRIKAPGYPTPGYPTDLGAFNSSFDEFRHDPAKIGVYERQVQFKRLHFFAATDAGEAIAWDPNFHDVDRDDYAVYILLRSSDAPELLAVSFKKFIFDVCLGDGYSRLFAEETHWDTAKNGNQLVFWPWIDADCQGSAACGTP